MRPSMWEAHVLVKTKQNQNRDASLCRNEIVTGIKKEPRCEALEC